MPHIRTPSRKPASKAPSIALATALVTAALGLAACGGSSSTSSQTSANAAATSASATTTDTTGTTTTATTPPGSSTGSPGVPPAGRPNRLRFTAMRACLAKKGIVLPQRTPGVPGLSGGGAQQLPKGMTRAQLAEALKSCGGPGFAGGRFGGGFRRGGRSFDNPRFHKALENFATCMRQNGVDVGEPNTSGKGPIFDTKGISTGSPQFRAASTKCRTALFDAVPHRATPGAAGSATG